MLSIFDKINNSKWYHNRVNNIDTIHICLTRKLKYLKNNIYGKGKMMKKYDDIISLYYRNNIIGLEMYRNSLEINIPLHRPHYHKYIELVILINFLLDYDKIDDNYKNKFLEEKLKYIHIDHELGCLIKNMILKIQEIYKNECVRKSD